jgi:hypothetical protein
MLSASACDGSGGNAGGSIVRDSAGITIVENDHTRPALSEVAVWKVSAEPTVRIGTVSGDSTQQLFQVSHSRRLADGRIAVVNSGSAEVRLFDSAGRYLNAIGGRGEGPGEFRAPWAVHQIQGDSVLVIDLYREISIFDADGKFARRFLPERPEGFVLGEGFEPVGAFGDGSLLFRSHYREQGEGLRRTRIQMIRTLLDGSFGGSLGDFDDQTIMSGVMYMFGPWAREAPTDSTMWYGPGDRFEIREIAFDGTVRRLIRLDRPATPVTESDIAAFKESVVERVRGTRSEEITNRRLAEAQFAAEFPAHYELMVDADNNLWVQDYQAFNTRNPRTWTVFAPDGRFLGNVVIPAGVFVHEIGSDYILGKWTDELDVEYVVLHRLDK